MSHYLKPFFMIYLLLFTFISVAQETTFDERGLVSLVNSGDSDVCFDLIADVRPLDHQIRNLWDLVEGYQIDIPGGDITRLELLFGVRRPESPERVRQAIGIGKVRRVEVTENLRGYIRSVPMEYEVHLPYATRNLQADLGALFDNSNVRFGFRFAEYPSGRITSYVVQEVVRDGYNKLRNILEEPLGDDFRPRRPVSHVSAIQGDRILVPVGRSDHIQEADVFYVYSRGDYNACSSDVRSLTLARATAVRMNDTSSILAINVALGGSRSVQVGDVVELSHEIDFASRLQANTDFRTRRVLQFDVPNIYAFNDRRVWINVTAYIKHFLLTEASEFGFRAIIKEE